LDLIGRGALIRAQQHLNANDHNSAANYARAAFEFKIKAYCEKHSVPVPYNRTPRKVKAEAIWDNRQESCP